MKMHHKIGHWMRDYVYMVHGAVAGVIYSIPPKHFKKSTVEGKVPVVIIPGVLGRWGFMKKIADALSADGHSIYVVPSLGYNLFSIPRSARFVRQVINKEKIEECIIVAHSKGGLIGKYLMIHKNDDDKVKKTVSPCNPVFRVCYGENIANRANQGVVY